MDTKSPLGKFFVKINLQDAECDAETPVKVSSHTSLKDDPIFAVECANEPQDILESVQKVSQSHSVYLMEKEKEDIGQFLVNRGFLPQASRIIT